MSASQDKKRRAESLADAEAQASETTKKKMDPKKKYTIIAICCAVAFVLLTVFVLVFNSNLFFNKTAAVTVSNGTYTSKFTVADFNFYYVNQYNSYYSEAESSYGDYVSYFTPSTDISLRDQEYDSASGETWAEHFEDYALETMLQVAALCNEAEINGFTITDEDRGNIETEMYNLFLNGYVSYGYRDTDSYLEYLYGKGMNSDIYKKNLEMSILANNYAAHIMESFEYTTDALDAYYSEHADEYDYFEYRVFNIAVEDTESEDSWAEALETAEKFESEITDEQSFIDLAYEYASDEEKETYEDESATMHSYNMAGLPSLYSEWLLDADRKEGDTTIVESSDKYIVVYYVGRDINDYKTVNGTYFLIAPESISEDDYDSDDAYNAAVENAKEAARDVADTILEESADSDYETLNETYSVDISDYASVEKVGRHNMDANLINWFFDEARKEGDSEILYIENAGYYVLFFDGYDELAYRVLADNDLRTADYETYVEDLTAPYELKTSWVMRLTKKMSSLGA